MADIFDSLMETMGRHGGYRLNSPQVDALTSAAFVRGNDGHLHVNKDLHRPGPGAFWPRRRCSFPPGIQLLYGETGVDHPFVDHEQMMPFMPFIRVPNVDRAIELAKNSEHGFGHTAVLHSRDTSVMQKMGRVMDCTIFVINGPCTDGLASHGEGFLVLDRGADGRGGDDSADVQPAARTATIGSMRFL